MPAAILHQFVFIENRISVAQCFVKFCALLAFSPGKRSPGFSAYDLLVFVVVGCVVFVADETKEEGVRIIGVERTSVRSEKRTRSEAKNEQRFALLAK